MLKKIALSFLIGFFCINCSESVSDLRAIDGMRESDPLSYLMAVNSIRFEEYVNLSVRSASFSFKDDEDLITSLRLVLKGFLYESINKVVKKLEAADKISDNNIECLRSIFDQLQKAAPHDYPCSYPAALHMSDAYTAMIRLNGIISSKSR